MISLIKFIQFWLYFSSLLNSKGQCKYANYVPGCELFALIFDLNYNGTKVYTISEIHVMFYRISTSISRQNQRILYLDHDTAPRLK